MVPFRYNTRSLLVRKVTTIVTAVGIAMTVFVFAAALMLGEGVTKALAASGRPDTVIVLRKGSDAELPSALSSDNIAKLKRSEVAQTSDSSGVIAEIVIVVTADLAEGEGISNVLIRGTPADGIKFRPEIKIVSGRLPAPGTNEAIVGKAIAGRFKGVALGQSFDLRRNRPLTIVGVFSAEGSSYESEVWGDVDVIRTSLGRGSVVSSARVRLTSPDQFNNYRLALEGDKQLNVKVMREADYYAKQSEQTGGFLKMLGFIAAFLFAVAAMIGAAITMNGAVAHRSKEIGTLRALGFSRFAILVSFLLEAILLAIIGGLIGLACVMAMTLVKFPVMNFQTFSEIVIGFRATGGVVVASLVFSLFMGILGGMFPAIRASRVSPVEAMRA